MKNSVRVGLGALFLALCFGLPIFAQTWRDYSVEVTSQNVSDAKYVIRNLAQTKHEIQLMMQAASMWNAGGRLDSVHPLRFLACIFSDEEMKVNMMIMRKEGLYSSFVKNLGKTLSEEADRNNLTPEQVNHFAMTLQVDPDKYWALVQSQQWEGIVANLISDLPRQGEYRRHSQ